MLSSPRKPSSTIPTFSSDDYCLRVARLMSLTIFSPGVLVVFLIVHSSVVTMSNKPSLSKYRYLDP